MAIDIPTAAAGPKVIDFSAGYRSATNGSTLKALQQRRADIQGQMEAAMKPREIASAWQGGAQLADVISGGIREGRAANQEAAGRARFAQLLAGGLAPDEIGEAMGLDPETAMKYQQNQWDVKSAADRVEAERENQRRLFEQQDKTQQAGFTHDDTVTEDQQTHDIKLQNDAQEAARILASDRATAEEKQRAQEVIDRAKEAETLVTTGRETTRLENEAEVAEIGKKTEARKEEWLRLNPEGDINSPEAQAFILRDSAEPTGGFLGPAGIKAVQEFKEQGNVLTTGLNDINEAKALVPLALTGDIGRKVAELASMGGEKGIEAAVWGAEKLGYPVTRDQIQATIRLYQIMDNVATTRMSGTLKGQTSNLEMDKFTKIFAAAGATPEAKMQALISLEQAFKTDRDAVSATLQGSAGEGLPEYKYVPVTGGMTPAADAAAATPAVGTDEPKEGDVFSAPGKPDLVYKNGQYVPVGAP